MPDLVYNVTIGGGIWYEQRLLIFYYGDEFNNFPIVIPSKVPLELGFVNTDFTSGKKTIVVEARADRVFIRGSTS